MDDKDFAVFFQAYLVCALWSSTECDADGQNCRNLDDNYGVEDIAHDSRTAQEEECRSFCESNLDKLQAAVAHPGYTWERAGHDFWLTRCGHGAGFWDRGLPDNLGDELSDASRLCGNIDPYVGDDGQVYFS